MDATAEKAKSEHLERPERYIPGVRRKHIPFSSLEYETEQLVGLFPQMGSERLYATDDALKMRPRLYLEHT